MSTKIFRSATLLSAFIAALISQNSYAEDSPVGIWTTIDDATHQARAAIQIVEKDHTLSGTLIDLRNPADRDKICTKCEGDQKDRPLLGIKILSGLRKTGENEWSDGTILDPANGKIYDAKIKVSDGGNEMTVRGFLGFSLIGRTQTWIRKQ
jgi:uncharacterized protein (DUF2147 family)